MFGNDEAHWRSICNLYFRPPPPHALERFTEHARRAIALAEEEASSDGAAAVGTEHLLIGLLHESDGAAAAAFREWHIELGDPARLDELRANRHHDAPRLPFDKSATLPFNSPAWRRMLGSSGTSGRTICWLV